VTAAHDHEPARYGRAFAIGIALNLVFVAVEAIYGWRADSLALLADAGHNLADVAALVLAWGGLLATGLRPNRRHTYGWQRASILASFANALLLLVAMGVLFREALFRLSSPVEMSGATVMTVAAIGVVVNGVTAFLFAAGRKADLNVRGAFLHMAADALVSLGVVTSGALYALFGWPWLDAVMSLLIALIVVLGTWSLFRQSLHLLLDGVPDAIALGEVEAYLRSLPGVEGLHDLHVWATSTSKTALTVHLLMPGGYPDPGFLKVVSLALLHRFEIAHTTIQVETECLDDACAPASAFSKGKLEGPAY
jgi:cobalt-zinc-cadmium efflux system protein